MTRHTVTFDFTSRKVAEEFAEGVMEWLLEPVLNPDYVFLSSKESERQLFIPRHWGFEDTSPRVTTEEE